MNWNDFKTAVLDLVGEDAEDLNPIKQRQIDQALRAACSKMQVVVPSYQHGHETVYGFEELVEECLAMRGDIPNGADIREVFRYGRSEEEILPDLVATVRVNGVIDTDYPAAFIDIFNGRPRYRIVLNGSDWDLFWEPEKDLAGTVVGAYILAPTGGDGMDGPHWFEEDPQPEEDIPTYLVEMTISDAYPEFAGWEWEFALGEVNQLALDCVEGRSGLNQIDWSRRHSIIDGNIRDRDVWCLDPNGNRFYTPALLGGESIHVFWTGIKLDFGSGDTLPWGEEAAEAVSHYVNAQIDRKAKSKINEYGTYMGDWQAALHLLAVTEKGRREAKT